MSRHKYLYKASKAEFIHDVEYGIRGHKIQDVLKSEMSRYMKWNEIPESDYERWSYFPDKMAEVLKACKQIPDTATCCIGYRLPISTYRIDFIITGYGNEYAGNGKTPVIIYITLKDWQKIKSITKSSNVVLDDSESVHIHPARQIYNYRLTMDRYNTFTRLDPIKIECVYMPDYERKENDELLNNETCPTLSEVRVFTKGEIDAFGQFIADNIVEGDQGKILDDMDSADLILRKDARNNIIDAIEENEYFALLDDEEKYVNIIFDSIMQMKDIKHNDKKRIYIINGGAGTGKTVIALRLLAKLKQENLNVQYVTKTSDIRTEIKNKLEENEELKNISIKNNFKSSHTINMNTDSTDIDCYIVDEAHRLVDDKKNDPDQVERIIQGAKVIVFLVDDNQLVTEQDIGTVRHIYESSHNYEVYEAKLTAEFRCNNGYMDFLDYLMNNKEMKYHLNPDEYEFKVYDNAAFMREAIMKLNDGETTARVLSGLCWPWKSNITESSRIKSTIEDFTLENNGFQAQWNYKIPNSVWATDPSTIDSIGSIHTAQGMDFSYVGVMIGNDLKYYKDPITGKESIRAKKIHYINNDFRYATEEEETRIKNQYKVLMSRGTKGCYIYCTDSNLCNYIRRQYTKCIEEFRKAEESTLPAIEQQES